MLKLLLLKFSLIVSIVLSKSIFSKNLFDYVFEGLTRKLSKSMQLTEENRFIVMGTLYCNYTLQEGRAHIVEYDDITSHDMLQGDLAISGTFIIDVADKEEFTGSEYWLFIEHFCNMSETETMKCKRFTMIKLGKIRTGQIIIFREIPVDEMPYKESCDGDFLPGDVRAKAKDLKNTADPFKSDLKNIAWGWKAIKPKETDYKNEATKEELEKLLTPDFLEEMRQSNEAERDARIRGGLPSSSEKLRPSISPEEAEKERHFGTLVVGIRNRKKYVSRI